MKHLILSIFILLVKFVATGQVVTTSNEDLIKAAYVRFGEVQTSMKTYEQNKPTDKKEDLLKEVDARNTLIVALSSTDPKDLTDDAKKLIQKYKEERDGFLSSIQKIVEWEKIKNDYEFKMREVTTTINILQQSIDRTKISEATKIAIEQASQEQKNIRNKQAGRFVASVYTLRSMLDVLSGVYSTGSSIIILDKETNKKTAKIIRNASFSALSIVGGVLALNSFQEKKNGEGFTYFGAGITLNVVGELFKNNKKAEYAFEASMRNVLFGDVIRKHEHVVERMKVNVNKLYERVIPIGVEEDGWFPTEAEYISFEQVISDRDELQLFLYDIRQQAELLLQTNLNQTNASRGMLQRMITDANTSEARWTQDRLLFNQNIAFIKTEISSAKKK